MVGNENFNLNLQNDDEEFAVNFGAQQNDDEEFVVNFGEVINVGGGGTSNFNELTNRPKYNSQTMTGNTNIPNVPTKTSDLTNDGSSGDSTYVEASALAPVATTGDYDDLIDKPTIPAAQIQSDWTQTDNTKLDYIKNKPTIPTVNDATLTITQNGVSKGTFTANDADDTTIEVTDTTYSDFVGTTGAVAGTAGLVPAPTTSDTDKFLKSNGAWATVPAGPTVVQTTGQSTTDVMSQKAVTDIVGNVESALNIINNGTGA